MLLAGTPEFYIFTLVLMRMSGFVFLNPIWGRRNIPALFKTGLTLLLAVTVYPSAGTAQAGTDSALLYGVVLLKEFAVGYVLALVMQIFEMAVTYAGSVIDYQMGLSMSTIYDAQNGTQVALTGNILQIYFLLLFFAVDGHLALMKIIMTSQEVVPYGAVAIGTEAAEAILRIFIECVVLAVKLAFPIIAFEFLVEVGTGLLMRIIPQINLFVISIQLRVIIGVVMMVFLLSPMGDYIGNIITEMMKALQALLRTVGQT